MVTFAQLHNALRMKRCKLEPRGSDGKIPLTQNAPQRHRQKGRVERKIRKALSKKIRRISKKINADCGGRHPTWNDGVKERGKKKRHNIMDNIRQKKKKRGNHRPNKEKTEGGHGRDFLYNECGR